MGRSQARALLAWIVLGCAGALAAGARSACGQASPAQQGAGSPPSGGNPFPGDTSNVPVMPSKDNPGTQRQPGDAAPAAPGAAGPQGGSNPFPEDTGNVPVMPSHGTPALPGGTSMGGAGFGLPAEAADPVKSPDDPESEAPAGSASFSSSNVPGLDKILDKADSDDTQQDQKRKHRGSGGDSPAEHKETSSEDIGVGKYYLEKKNWKAALSRFESALVLAPEEPEVYWGLAESERGLGQFADARANYKKLLDYDPDGPHGKAARKALADPEIAHAQAVAPAAIDAGKNR